MIPTTKDGKHKLIFSHDFRDNHGLNLRAALEGRAIWNIIGLDKDKRRFF